MMSSGRRLALRSQWPRVLAALGVAAATIVVAATGVASPLGTAPAVAADGTARASGARLEAEAVPAPLPAIALTHLDGRPVDLADFSGRVVVLNVWATWCGPCIQELPSLQRLGQRYAGRDVQVLAASAGDTVAEVRRFLDKHPLTLTILLNPDRSLLRAWRLRALPTTYILDPAGRVRYRFVGEREWDHPEVMRALENLLSGG